MSKSLKVQIVVSKKNKLTEEELAYRKHLRIVNNDESDYDDTDFEWVEIFEQGALSSSFFDDVGMIFAFDHTELGRVIHIEHTVFGTTRVSYSEEIYNELLARIS